MDRIATIIIGFDHITLVPMGGPSYAIKGKHAKLGDVLKGPHYYTKDYADIGVLAYDIVKGEAEWIYTEGGEHHGRS